MNRLDEIVAYKRANGTSPSADLEARAAAAAPPPISLLETMGTHRAVVIAECKKASPSAGVLAAAYDPVRLAKMYEDAGASAISVLTDERFFQGSLDDLAAVCAAVEIPVLRKDFTLWETDLLEARAHGADLILLIVRILTDSELARLLRATTELGMEAIVEVHDESEVTRALEVGAPLIGVNNRDLATLGTDLDVTERLLRMIPAQVAVIGESGITTGAQVARLREAGVRAVLVGEALMRAANPDALLRELVDAGCPDCWRMRLQESGSETVRDEVMA